MPQIMIVLTAILFLGCGTKLSTSNINPPHPQQLKSKEVQDIEGNSTIPESIEGNLKDDSTIPQTIEGKYTLKEGRFSYNENIKIDKVVNSSDLIIEKLDDDDYGYYFTMQVENLTPAQEFGIFHKKGNEYFKRIIYSTDITKDSNISIDSNISDKNLKTEITDKVKLSLDNNNIKINMKVENGEITIIWTKDTNPSTLKTKELQKTEHEYLKTYKERFLKYFKDI